MSGGDWHGTGGPVPIRRPSAGELSPLQRAFADAAAAAGHQLVGDDNEPGTVGVGPAPRNVRDGLRMSTALTHLAAARGLPNLTIRAGTAVDRVELRGTTARGVRTAGGEIIEADAIVVTAGSYASPAILMRSGIGPAAALRDLGIQVAADLPGVGDNLIDHPLAAVDLPTTPGFAGPRFQVMLTLRSSLADPGGGGAWLSIRWSAGSPVSPTCTSRPGMWPRRPGSTAMCSAASCMGHRTGRTSAVTAPGTS